MEQTPSIEGLIELYEKQTLDTPLPEPIDPRTQRLGLGDEVLVMSDALAESLRESSMRLAPSVGEYDYENVVSANNENMDSMDLEAVSKQPEIDIVAFLEEMIRNKAITKWQLISMFEYNNINIRDPEEQERLLKMVDSTGPFIRPRQDMTWWPRERHPDEPHTPWPPLVSREDIDKNVFN